MSFKGDGIGKKVSGGVYPLEILLSVCISPVRNGISKGQEIFLTEGRFLTRFKGVGRNLRREERHWWGCLKTVMDKVCISGILLCAVLKN